MTLRRQTEDAHKLAASALGLVAGMLARGRLQPLTVAAVADDLRAAADQLEDVSRAARPRT